MIRGMRYAYHADDKVWQEYTDVAFRAEVGPKRKPKIQEADPARVKRDWHRLATGLRGIQSRNK